MNYLLLNFHLKKVKFRTSIKTANKISWVRMRLMKCICPVCLINFSDKKSYRLKNLFVFFCLQDIWPQSNWTISSQILPLPLWADEECSYKIIRFSKHLEQSFPTGDHGRPQTFFPGKGKIYYFLSKKSKNILFWPAKGGKCPLLPSPADAHAGDPWVLWVATAIATRRAANLFFNKALR